MALQRRCPGLGLPWESRCDQGSLLGGGDIELRTGGWIGFTLAVKAEREACRRLLLDGYDQLSQRAEFGVGGDTYPFPTYPS